MINAPKKIIKKHQGNILAEGNKNNSKYLKKKWHKK